MPFCQKKLFLENPLNNPLETLWNLITLNQYEPGGIQGAVLVSMDIQRAVRTTGRDEPRREDEPGDKTVSCHALCHGVVVRKDFTQQLRILRKKFLFKLVNQRFAEFRIKLSVHHSLLSLAYSSRASKILASRILLGKMEDKPYLESSNSIMRVGYIQSGLGLSFEMEQIAYITNDLQDCLLNVLVHNQATVVIEKCKSIFADLIWKPFRKMRTIRVLNGRPSRYSAFRCVEWVNWSLILPPTQKVHRQPFNSCFRSTTIVSLIRTIKKLLWSKTTVYIHKNYQ